MGGPEVLLGARDVHLGAGRVTQLERHFGARLVQQADQQVVVLIAVARQGRLQLLHRARVVAEARLRQRELALRLQEAHHDRLFSGDGVGQHLFADQLRALVLTRAVQRVRVERAHAVPGHALARWDARQHVLERLQRLGMVAAHR
jgi:hypothetical protein